MSAGLSNVVFVVVLLGLVGAFVAGVRYERWRAGARRASGRARAEKPAKGVDPFKSRPAASVFDAAGQLRIVMQAEFTKRPLLSKSEARFLYAAEQAIRNQKLRWRVMAQVSLGEVLASRDPKAYQTINSKRVDLLIISQAGDPIAAIEYQGEGHYQGTAPARDAVKKEALRRAGVRYIEMTPEHDAQDVAREIARIASGEVRPDVPEQISRVVG